MQNEIWKPIKGLEGQYEVSNFGRIKSLSRFVKCRNENFRKLKEKILKNNIGTNGYYYVILPNKKTRYIHRVVADTFLINDKNLSDVDHIDENKLNNNLDNLRFLSHFENSSRSNKGKKIDLHLSKNPKAKKVYCFENGNLKFIYGCAKQISIDFKLNYSTVKNRLQKNNLTINNLNFSYYEY